MKNLIFSACILILVVATSFFLYPELNGSAIESSKAPKDKTRGVQKDTLQSFSSQKELNDFLATIKEARQRRDEDSVTVESKSDSNSVSPQSTPAPSEDESVTNVQHAGVDEGGIVKLHGDHLIVLRRGRLFTVAVGDDSLKPISSIDAFGPDIDPSGTWYDEMLISGDTIAVIGYSYSRGGTEVGIFNITRSGGLSYRSTYHLRSNDYYSSRNYASRLIGNKLIFYTPLYLGYGDRNPMSQLPAVRKWRKGATNKDFKYIGSPSRTYKPVYDLKDSYNMALHTVTSCNLDDREFKCEATSVVGPAGRVFYVSPESVYVWTTDWIRNGRTSKTRSVLYQMPLDGSAPKALGVMGSPIDQFSFLESRDNHLNVVVRSDGYGDGMWSSEFTRGDVALLRIPTKKFGDGRKSISNDYYRELPRPQGHAFQNRFIGKYLIYGSGNRWDVAKKGSARSLFTVNWKSGETKKLPLVHGVERIEGMGRDAVVVGSAGKNLYFTPVKLGNSPRIKPAYLRENASQGEDRSHGFFYKTKDSNSGLLGLPIIGGGNNSGRYRRGSASILFLRNNSMKLNELGTLAARPKSSGNDGCRASCVDWYGNARPLFIKGRVFALLGYEIVEGTVTDDGIKERRRRSFSPAG